MNNSFVPKYHDAKDEAERLGVSLRTIRKWQAARRIPSIALSPGKGGVTRFNPAEVDEALRKMTVQRKQA
jgi:excisionase family DNA binding protein